MWRSCLTKRLAALRLPGGFLAVLGWSLGGVGFELGAKVSIEVEAGGVGYLCDVEVGGKQETAGVLNS